MKQKLKGYFNYLKTPGDYMVPPPYYSMKFSVLKKIINFILIIKVFFLLLYVFAFFVYILVIFFIWIFLDSYEVIYLDGIFIDKIIDLVCMYSIIVIVYLYFNTYNQVINKMNRKNSLIMDKIKSFNIGIDKHRLLSIFSIISNSNNKDNALVDSFAKYYYSSLDLIRYYYISIKDELNFQLNYISILANTENKNFIFTIMFQHKDGQIEEIQDLSKDEILIKYNVIPFLFEPVFINLIDFAKPNESGNIDVKIDIIETEKYLNVSFANKYSDFKSIYKKTNADRLHSIEMLNNLFTDINKIYNSKGKNKYPKYTLNQSIENNIYTISFNLPIKNIYI